MKHNKKRNTAFVYEALVRTLTKAIIDKDLSKKEVIVSILKEYFCKGSILATELELYHTLLETHDVRKEIAEKILNETKLAHTRIDSSDIFDAQSKIIKSINKGLGSQTWSTFVPNFKSLASVNSIFGQKTSVKRKVLFEQAIVDRMSENTSRSATETLEPIDNLTYKSFIDKFNNKYSTLLREQKELLNRYITSFADEGFELRVYLNEELRRLKEELQLAKEASTETFIVEKLNGVESYLDQFRQREFAPDDLSKILKTQELIGELANQ